MRFYMVLVACMVVPFLVLGQNQKWETWKVNGDSAFNKNDFKEAIQWYTKSIENSKLKEGEHYQALYMRAAAYYSMGSFSEALLDINRYIQNQPNTQQAYLLRAFVNRELDNPEEQLKDLNRLLAGNPNQTDWLRWKVSVLMDMEKYEEGRKILFQLKTFQPNASIDFFIGLSYYFGDQGDSAIIYFDQAIQKEPNYFPPYFYATSLSLQEEAYGLALDYVNKAIALEPENLSLYFFKGVALVEIKELKEGCRFLSKAFYGGYDEAKDYLVGYCYDTAH